MNPDLHQFVVIIAADKDPRRRSDAVRGIGKLREEGAPAVSIMLRLGQSWSTKDGRAILHGQGGVDIVMTLTAIAPDDRAVATALIGWLHRSWDAEMRKAAAQALPQTSFAKEAVNGLTLSLRTDPVDFVRLAAVQSLGEIGSDAKEAVKALEVAKVDSSAAVREAADVALKKIQGDK